MNEGLYDAVKAVANARRDGDGERLNEALSALSRLSEALFRDKIERRLNSYQESFNGYSVSLEDAADVLNEILWIVCQKADRFRGSTDAEACAWLKKIVERKVSDKGRVALRRAKKWRGFFAIVPRRLRGMLEISSKQEC